MDNGRGFLFAKRRSVAGRLPRKAAPLCPTHASATARRAPDGQGRELIDGVAAGAPVRQLLFVEALGHARVPFAGDPGRITAPGSSWPQLMRIVQRNRRPTSKVEFNDRVAREARRGRFEIGDFRSGYCRRSPLRGCAYRRDRPASRGGSPPARRRGRGSPRRSSSSAHARLRRNRPRGSRRPETSRRAP